MLEKAKKLIRIRMIALWLMALCAWTMMLIDHIPAVHAILSEDIFNLHTGFASGMGVASMFFAIRFARMLRDPDQLKAWMTNEQDERTIAIRAKAGMPMLIYTSTAMIICGIIIAYWQPAIITKTLFTAGLIQLLIGLAAKTYYSKTM